MTPKFYGPEQVADAAEGPVGKQQKGTHEKIMSVLSTTGKIIGSGAEITGFVAGAAVGVGVQLTKGLIGGITGTTTKSRSQAA